MIRWDNFNLIVLFSILSQKEKKLIFFYKQIKPFDLYGF